MLSRTPLVLGRQLVLVVGRCLPNSKSTSFWSYFGRIFSSIYNPEVCQLGCGRQSVKFGL